MASPDSYVVTILQANVCVPLASVPTHVPGPGNVTVQAARGNDPATGVHVTPVKNPNAADNPGWTGGPLDSTILTSKFGIDLDKWYAYGTHVGDQVIITHGGAG